MYSRFSSLYPDGGPQSRVWIVQLLQSDGRSGCRVTVIRGHHIDMRMLTVRYRREIVRRWQTRRRIMQRARVSGRRWWYRTGWHRSLQKLARSRRFYTADRRRRGSRRRGERFRDRRRRFFAFLHLLSRRGARVAARAASGGVRRHVLLRYALDAGGPHRRYRRNFIEAVFARRCHAVHHRTRRTVARVIHN